MPSGRPHKCPYCGGTDTASKGARKTKTMGLRKIRRCKGCGRKFTPKSQKSIQAETPNSTQSEIPEPIQPCTPGSVDPELPRSIEPEQPSDEHPRFGL
jgi:hypothetical protein